MSGVIRDDVRWSETHGASALERLISSPAMREADEVIVMADPIRTWHIVRHLDLATSRLARALFAIRTLPGRVQGQRIERRLTLDDLVSSPERPGFQILEDCPPHEVVVGAIGKVWQLAIPFVHVDDADAFARFDEPGFIKVAWAIRVVPDGAHATRVQFELRVAATDGEAWRRFERYFRLIGPGSHFIRQSALRWLARAVKGVRHVVKPVASARRKAHARMSKSTIMGTLLLSHSSCSADEIICETFTALPTLCLTDAQARRLWHLDAASCDGALTGLVRAGFLRITTDGRYHRADHQPDAAYLVTFD